MWFKNVQPYRLTHHFPHSPEELAEAIAQQVHRPCTAMDLSTYGWVPPLGRRSEALTHAAAGKILLCACKEEKVLPPASIRDEVAKRANAIEQEQDRLVGRKERQQLKDDVVREWAPTAFTRSTLTYAYIDPKGGWIVVDASTAKKAEELLSLLRRGLGTLPTQPPAVKQSPSTVMTRWLAGEIPSDSFQFLDECVLRETSDEGGSVRCRRQDLRAEEVQSHLQAGKQVERLAVTWGERLSGLLCADLTLKRLRFEHVVAEELDDTSDDEFAAYDAQFALMTLELGRFLPALMDAFGGVIEEEA